jgi:predicted metal-dependent phosphoesterase TrpH
MPADLHIHSNLSDGSDSPEELVRLAKAAGLTAIALTDHDIVDGIPRAQAEAKAAGLEVIPGIEFTTEEKRCEVHILGYFIDPANAELTAALARIQEGRVKRIYKIAKKLRALKIEIAPEEVLALSGGKAPGRPHVARLMVKLGIVPTIKEAFNRYLDHRSPAYVPHYKLTPAEAVGLIKRSGGIPVFAHPVISNCDDLIGELTGAGLRGIEAIYPGYTPEQSEHYRALAVKHGLLITGGSDYHGANFAREQKLGELPVPDELVEKLKNEPARGN